MERVPTDWISELAGVRPPSPCETNGDESEHWAMQGELELLAGKVALRHGELERSGDLLAAAAAHLSDPGRKPELAGQLLALAKAWTRRKDDPRSASEAERALRAAVTLDRAQAMPALAQHLQRQSRPSEAIECWRDALRVSPDVGTHFLNLGRLYEQTGRIQEAVGTYLELIAVAPTAKNYLIVAQRLDELGPALPEPTAAQAVKIALLGNATLDHLRGYLNVEVYRAGMRPEIYQGGFDQYTQDILNPYSELYAFSPDVIVLAVHASRLFPRIHHYPFDMSVEERRAELDVGLNTLRNLLDALTERSSALILLHNMVAPHYPALGIADWRDDLGQAELFGEINARLAGMVRDCYKDVYVVDEERVQARSGKARATDPRLWLTARMAWSDSVLPALAKEYVRFLKPYKALSRKCIVLDLDNTLWGGVVGEDGVGGIQLGADAPGNAFVAFQRELERLWRRGILLAVASKNNLDDATAVFEQHPAMVLKQSHFAAQRINWQPKSDNVREIAKELNIGLDSLVFLDDNPVERAKMRAELPQVLTVELPSDPAYYRSALLELDVFDSLALTEEDRRRNQLYSEQRARRDFESTLDTGGGSLEEFLRELDMVMEIEPDSAQTMPRIVQLTNKTNQFNLTTRRYGEAQIAGMKAAGAEIFTTRVTDRFGDNGYVGVAILTPTSTDMVEVDTLLLSCRVMGRGVETAFLAFLADRARERGARRLHGRYIPTAKNAPVRNFYREHGFTLIGQEPDGAELWGLDLDTPPIEVPSWLTVRTPVPAS